MQNYFTGLKAVKFINDHKLNNKQLKYHILLSMIEAGILETGTFGYSKMISESELIGFAVEYGYLLPGAESEFAESDAIAA